MKSPQFHCEVEAPEPPRSFVTITWWTRQKDADQLNEMIKMWLPDSQVEILSVRWPE